jgi:hypothetical protein
MSTRGPRGRFLALEPAQAGFKQLEIAVTNVFVAMFSGSLSVRRARRGIVVLGRVSFRDGPFVRLVRHVSGKIDRVKRLPWRDAHMVVLPLLQLKFRLFLEAALPAPRNKIEHGVRARQASPTGAA